MTRKEQNIILDRLNKLQLTVDYNNDLYRQTGGRILQYIRRPLSGYAVLISCFAFIICADIPVDELIGEVTKKYNKYHLESEVKDHERN